MKWEKRNFKGIWIPENIWFNDDLPMIEKILLVEINELEQRQKKPCTASNEYFSKYAGVTDARCSAVIRSLGAKGYVSIKYLRKGPHKSKRLIIVLKGF